MKKKGQAAMEFLMTYGWAILVVLAAIAALAYFGVLNPGAMLPERTVFSGQVPNVDNAVIRTDSNITVAFRNNAGQAIKINSDSTTYGGGDGCDVNDIAVFDDAAVLLPFTSGTFTEEIKNGDIFSIRFSCVEDFDPGDTVSTALTFEYKNTATTLERPVTGTVEGRAS